MKLIKQIEIMKNRNILPEDNEDLDQDRIRQSKTNLTMVDRRPGESTFPNGTKNHSTKYDHAQSDIPLELINDITLEDNLHVVDDLYEAEQRALQEDELSDEELENLTMEDLEEDELDEDDEEEFK
ncbi:hypothetical protein [Telluribacter sp.]|uniref:hypothetical protein n=1 Tax=Telluribacter sp. TaxID=1978767 RepID=UPI002E1039A8